MFLLHSQIIIFDSNWLTHNLAAFFSPPHITVEKGDQIATKFKIINWECSKTEYRTQVNDKGPILILQLVILPFVLGCSRYQLFQLPVIFTITFMYFHGCTLFYSRTGFAWRLCFLAQIL